MTRSLLHSTLALLIVVAAAPRAVYAQTPGGTPAAIPKLAVGEPPSLWFSEGNRVRETLLDIQLLAGEQWAVGAGTQLVNSGRAGGSLAFARRWYLGASPVGLSTGLVFNFPVTDAPSDLLQLLARFGLAFAVHPQVQVEVDALLGPNLEFFRDAFFGGGIRAGLVAGPRVDAHFLLGHGENVPYIVVHGCVLGGLSLPEHMSWSVGVGVGIALGGDTSANML